MSSRWERLTKHHLIATITEDDGSQQKAQWSIRGIRPLDRARVGDRYRWEIVVRMWGHEAGEPWRVIVPSVDIAHFESYTQAQAWLRFFANRQRMPTGAELEAATAKLIAWKRDPRSVYAGFSVRVREVCYE